MKSSLTASLVLLAAAASARPTVETDASIALRALENRATTCSAASTDNLIFSVSIGTFLNARSAQNPTQCIWASDNCSKSPDKPRGYDFIPGCQRHDFGYRNTKSQGRFTSAMKKRIDDNFKNDLYTYCSQFSGLSSWKGVECRRYADIYYAAVRAFGKRELEFDEASGKYVARAEPGKFDNFDGSELDDDIEGQVIPEVHEGAGRDVENLEELFTE